MEFDIQPTDIIKTGLGEEHIKLGVNYGFKSLNGCIQQSQSVEIGSSIQNSLDFGDIIIGNGTCFIPEFTLNAYISLKVTFKNVGTRPVNGIDGLFSNGAGNLACNTLMKIFSSSECQFNDVTHRTELDDYLTCEEIFNDKKYKHNGGCPDIPDNFIFFTNEIPTSNITSYEINTLTKNPYTINKNLSYPNKTDQILDLSTSILPLPSLNGWGGNGFFSILSSAGRPNANTISDEVEMRFRLRQNVINDILISSKNSKKYIETVIKKIRIVLNCNTSNVFDRVFKALSNNNGQIELNSSSLTYLEVPYLEYYTVNLPEITGIRQVSKLVYDYAPTIYKYNYSGDTITSPNQINSSRFNCQLNLKTMPNHFKMAVFNKGISTRKFNDLEAPCMVLNNLRFYLNDIINFSSLNKFQLHDLLAYNKGYRFTYSKSVFNQSVFQYVNAGNYNSDILESFTGAGAVYKIDASDLTNGFDMLDEEININVDAQFIFTAGSLDINACGLNIPGSIPAKNDYIVVFYPVYRSLLTVSKLNGTDKIIKSYSKNKKETSIGNSVVDNKNTSKKH